MKFFTIISVSIFMAITNTKGEEVTTNPPSTTTKAVDETTSKKEDAMTIEEIEALKTGYENDVNDLTTMIQSKENEKTEKDEDEERQTLIKEIARLIKKKSKKENDINFIECHNELKASIDDKIPDLVASIKNANSSEITETRRKILKRLGVDLEFYKTNATMYMKMYMATLKMMNKSAEIETKMTNANITEDEKEKFENDLKQNELNIERNRSVNFLKENAFIIFYGLKDIRLQLDIMKLKDNKTDIETIADKEKEQEQTEKTLDLYKLKIKSEKLKIANDKMNETISKLRKKIDEECNCEKPTTAKGDDKKEPNGDTKSTTPKGDKNEETNGDDNENKPQDGGQGSISISKEYFVYIALFHLMRKLKLFP